MDLATFASHADRFLDLSEQIRDGQKGVDYAVLRREWEGYEETPLEAQLSRCAMEGLRKGLDEDPQVLTPDLLHKTLLGVLNCRPAIGGYRARLRCESGGFGNEESPVAMDIHGLIVYLRKALRRLPGAGQFLLASLPADLLDAELTLYDERVADGRLASFTLSLRDHLTTEDWGVH